MSSITFRLAGAGVCCRVRLAAELLVLSFAALGCCQVLAATEAEIKYASRW